MPTDNYLTTIVQMQATGALPRVGVAQVEVLHDDWCALLAKQGPCTCDPDVRLKYALPDTAKN